MKTYLLWLNDIEISAQFGRHRRGRTPESGLVDGAIWQPLCNCSIMRVTLRMNWAGHCHSTAMDDVITTIELILGNGWTGYYVSACIVQLIEMGDIYAIQCLSSTTGVTRVWMEGHKRCFLSIHLRTTNYRLHPVTAVNFAAQFHGLKATLVTKSGVLYNSNFEA